jgi:hypothetical protein
MDRKQVLNLTKESWYLTMFINPLISEADIKKFRNSVKFPNFSDYREQIVSLNKTFSYYKVDKRQYEFCSSLSHENTRDLFYNTFTEGPVLPTEGAAWLNDVQERNELFCTLYIRPSVFYDWAILRDLETGNASLLIDGKDLHLRHLYRRYFLHRVHPPFKFFKVWHLPKRGLLVWDHSHLEGFAMSAYACGRPDFARCFLRKQAGLAADIPEKFTANLIMSIMYDNKEWKDQAEREAVDFLKKRKGRSTQANINLFIGIIRQDAAMITDALAILAVLGPKVWSNTEDKIFNSVHHGFCSFAARHVAPEVFAGIRFPESKGWWPEVFRQSLTLPYPRPLPDLPFLMRGEISFIDDMARLIDEDIPLYAQGE